MRISKSKSPSARSVAELRKRNLAVATVEQTIRIPGGRVFKRDAYGFGDLLICGPGFGIALVQVTSSSNLSAREKKAREIPELKTWLASGGRFLLHGWAKRGPRGARKIWTLIEREITLQDFSSKNERETYESNSAD